MHTITNICWRPVEDGDRHKTVCKRVDNHLPHARAPVADQEPRLGDAAHQVARAPRCERRYDGWTLGRPRVPDYSHVHCVLWSVFCCCCCFLLLLFGPASARARPHCLPGSSSGPIDPNPYSPGTPSTVCVDGARCIPCLRCLRCQLAWP